MRPQILFIISLLVTQGLWAQDFDSDIDSEIDQISVEEDSGTEAQVYKSPGASRKLNRKMNKQPVTYVEATPLSDSRAEQMRRSRQDAELETEQRIVEKLESSRMEDEKRRAQILFGDKQLNTPLQTETVSAPAPVAPVVQEVRVIHEPIQQEVSMSANDEQFKGQDDTKTSFFSGLLGFGEFPSVDNVNANFNFGFSYGRIFNEKIVIEGSFLYSNFSIDSFTSAYYSNYSYSGYGYSNGYSPYSTVSVPAKIDVQQYSGQLATKYRFAEGIIKPTLGGVIQYSYRDYSWSKGAYSYNYYYNNQSADSHALDVGLSLGADFELDDSFGISLDYRYFKNVMSSSSDSHLYYIYSPQAQNPLEKLDFYSVILSLKISI
ncbi:MAG TPA: hypothetical protein PLJ21_12080 [Pseudobdellovibrionaceae bacterium]|nr:hypothetical protein [Pseudobdellovibrionaceae bacterium]